MICQLPWQQEPSCDLFFRLNVFPIAVPSLRKQGDDIPLLVEYFVGRFAKEAGKTIRHIGKDTLEQLQAYHWPGNIRELQNVVERAAGTETLCRGGEKVHIGAHGLLAYGTFWTSEAAQEKISRTPQHFLSYHGIWQQTRNFNCPYHG